MSRLTKHFIKFLLITLVLIFSSHLCYADVNEEARGYYEEGLRRYEQGQFEDAIQYMKKAINIYPDAAGIYMDIGFMYFLLNNFEETIRYETIALNLYNELSNKEGEAVAQFWLGRSYAMTGQHDKAVNSYKESIKLKPDVANAYSWLGATYMDLKQFQSSIESYKQSIKLDPNDAYAYNDLGFAHRELEDYKNAIEYYKEAIKLKPDFLSAHYAVGVSYMFSSDYEKAIESFNQAIRIAPDHAAAHQGIGLVYYALRKLDSAIEHQEIALKLYQKFSNKEAEAGSLYLLGKVYLSKGNDIFSLNYFQKALTTFRELKNLTGEVDVLNSIGNQYTVLGDYSAALDYHKKALSISEKVENDILLVRTLGFMTTTSFEALESPENYNEAVKHGKRAVEIAEKSEIKGGLDIYNAYQGLGSAYWSKKDYENALSLGDKFLKVLEELKNRVGVQSIITYYEASTYSLMGGAYITIGKYQQALEYVQKAIDLFDGMGDFDEGLKWISFWRRAIVNDRLGNLAKAKDDYLRAIDILETNRGYTQSLESKIEMGVSASKVYSKTVSLLLKTSDTDEAFNYMERAKARTFLDLLGTRFRLQDKNIFEEERRLQFSINYLSEKIREAHEKPDKNEHPQMKAALEKQLTEARTEYVALIEKIKKENPEISTLLTVNSLTLKQVQDLLDPETTLLEYFITPDKTLLWVVGKSDLKVIEIEIKDKDLKAKVTAFREKIAHLEPEYSKDADELYDLLIEPAKEYIKTKRVGIVPHSVLHYLPFHALLNKDKFLIEEYEMFYTPSASVLKFVYEKRKEVKGGILAFGNPDLGDELLNLPYAEDEVKQIKSANPGTAIYLKDGATEDRAKKLSSDYNVLHFASHGELNPAAPMFSSIRLAKDKNEDGRLEVNEIFNLNLKNTSLVTLSACETGLGKLTNGDELIGLSRGFIYAGTPSIVASLWRVNDQSTSQLMNLFYENLKTHPKSESLRKAQLEMIRGKTGKGIVRGVGGITSSKEANLKAEVKADLQSSQTVNGSHPYFWAPFILIGDWK